MQPPDTPSDTRSADIRHRPVLLDAVLKAMAPQQDCIYVDGTFGAGGYSKALLDKAACRVIAIDRDPDAIVAGAALQEIYADRLTLIEGEFSQMRELVAAQGISLVDGIVLDIGVSSMQLDEAERGFSFAKDGPLDMRMAKAGPSAADIINCFEESDLKRIIAVLGEERRAHAIARAIARARRDKPFARTKELSEVIAGVLGPQRAGERIHPATRTFQALRIFVNAELDQLVAGLSAAEHLLRPGGCLAVVSFHSLEDRIIKRFFIERSGLKAQPSRHLPEIADAPLPSFRLENKKGITADASEVEANPRARSARLRFGLRTAAPPIPVMAQALGQVSLNLKARPC